MSNKVLIFKGKYSEKAKEICDSMGYASSIYDFEQANSVKEKDTSLSRWEKQYPEYDRIFFAFDNGEKRVSAILDMQERRNGLCEYPFNTPCLRHMNIIYISSEVEIGEGCMVEENVSIQAGTKIGVGSIIEAGTVIGANCIIGEGCTIGSNCIIEDGCKIGAYCRIESDSCLHELFEIGSGSIINSN